MATWGDVREIGLRLPGVEVGTSWRTQALKVRGKWLCRERFDPDALVIGVADLAEKEALISESPDIYFTTAHYDGYPAILVRLEAIDLAELAELIEDAWRLAAGKRAVAAYDEDQARLGRKPT